jgi:hypothetical protein
MKKWLVKVRIQHDRVVKVLRPLLRGKWRGAAGGALAVWVAASVGVGPKLDGAKLTLASGEERGRRRRKAVAGPERIVGAAP